MASSFETRNHDMKFKRCHVKWDSHTAAAVKDAVGDEKGYPSTNNYKHFTVLDATVKAQPEGLLLIQGTLDLFQTWWGIFDDTPPPEGWPSNEVLRDWWNPLRYIQGPTYKAPYRGIV